MKKYLMSDKTNRSLIRLALIFTMILSVVSCNKIGLDPNGEDSGNVNIPDPEGTVTVNLNNGHSGNYYDIGFGYTYYNSGYDLIHIDEINNFSGKYNSIKFVSLGAVNGLGSITSIPTTGWAEEVAVIPGNGYVVRNTEQDMYNGSISHEYVRLYVVDYIIGTNNGIIGARIKYQYPFQP